jgi:hypothetical protein
VRSEWLYFMRFSASARVQTAWLSGAITDVCCPIAAREGALNCSQLQAFSHKRFD